MYSITLDVPARALEFAPVTRKWLMNFWPGVHVELHASHVTIASASVAEDRLRLLWTTALANELAFASANEQRREILRELIA
jgi:hypothetical protein